MSNRLPPGWTEAAIGGVAELQLGKMLDKARNVRGRPYPYLRNINVRWFSFDTSDLLEMRFEDHEAEKFAIRDGDVLVCEGGEPGRSAIWRGGPTELKYQKALHRMRPRAFVLPEWIALFLRHAANEASLEDHFTGTTIKHLPVQALAAIRLPLPPLAEQSRIVARVEALLARTRQAREEVVRARRLGERYRQGILASAFGDGDGVETVRVGDLLAAPPSNGISVRGSDRPPGVRALRLDALREGEIDLGRVRYIEIPEATVRRLRVQEGDFLVSRGNGSLHLLAKGAFAPEPAEVTVFPDTMIRLRFRRDRVHPGWLHHAWTSPVVRSQVEAKAKTTAGIWKVSQSDLESVELGVPPLDQQAVIAERIGASLARAGAAKREAARATLLMDRLDASVLSRAFRGELVPQDAADEPTSSLLGHLAAAKAPGSRNGRPGVA